MELDDDIEESLMQKLDQDGDDEQEISGEELSIGWTVEDNIDEFGNLTSVIPDSESNGSSFSGSPVPESPPGSPCPIIDLDFAFDEGMLICKFRVSVLLDP
jgi:hypothetical protein